MAHLLHISAGPRGASQRIFSPWLRRPSRLARPPSPEVQVDHLDLTTARLPHSGASPPGQKMAVSAAASPAPSIRCLGRRQGVFDSSPLRRIPLSVPDAETRSSPTCSRPWIDIVTQPSGYSASPPPNGYTGLITGKKAAIIYAADSTPRGHRSPFSSGFHVQLPRRSWLRFAGIYDVARSPFQPTV